MKAKRNPNAVDRALKALFGDPALMGWSEIEAAYEDLGGPVDIVERCTDLASSVARDIRLSKKLVPDHLLAALRALNAVDSLDKAPDSLINKIVERALTPFSGPVQRVAFSYRELSEKTPRDEELLNRLEAELKQPWTDDDGGDDGQ